MNYQFKSLNHVLNVKGLFKEGPKYVHNLAHMAIKHDFQNIQDMFRHSLPYILKPPDESNQYCMSFTNQNQILIWNFKTGMELVTIEIEDINQVSKMIRKFDPSNQIVTDNLSDLLKGLKKF